jgi:hypothetical protein
MNTIKTEAIVCKPKPDRGEISDHAYKRSMLGEGLSHSDR